MNDSHRATTHDDHLRKPAPTHGAPSSRVAAGVMLLVIPELTVATALIHLSLGGVLFTLNGLGYLGLAVSRVRGRSWSPRHWHGATAGCRALGWRRTQRSRSSRTW